MRKAFASFRLWRGGAVELCPTTGATQAELAGSARLLANVTPQILCQVRPTLSAPVVIRGKPLIIDLKGSSAPVTAGTLNIGVFTVPFGEITMIAESLTIRFPRVGRWQVGFVQNVVVHRGRLDYGRGVASWFVGTPMLDQADDRTDFWMNPPGTNPAIADVTSPGQAATVAFAAGDPTSIRIPNTLLNCGVLRSGVVSVFFRAGVVARLGEELHVLGATKGGPYGFHLTIEPQGTGYRFTRTVDVDQSRGAPTGQSRLRSWLASGNVSDVFRILSLSACSHSRPVGTLVTTPNSGHYIQMDEPELVTWAIRRVLYPSLERSLADAFKHGGESSLEKEFHIVKRLYPACQTNEAALDDTGNTLTRSGETRAVVLLALNMHEHPLWSPCIPSHSHGAPA